MDWSKAKNILIIAFIITNIFLFYNIYRETSYNNYFYNIDDEMVADVVTLLKDRNITVNGKIPKKLPELPILKVRYDTYDGEKVATRILKEFTKDEDDYVKDNETLSILYNDKFLSYERKPEGFKIKAMNKETAKKLSDQFIRTSGFYKADMEHWNTYLREDGHYEVIYKQKYKDMFIDDAAKTEDDLSIGLEMRSVVDSIGVVKFERKWVIPEGTKAHFEKVIPAPKALLMAMDKIERKRENNNEIIITDISLGYRLEMPQFDTFINGKWYDMETGYAAPYWRICLDTKECIYIEAHE